MLLAHSIFVSLGDVGNAERTAALHVHGLVDLARRTSLNEHYPEAWGQYGGVLRMLQTGTFGTADRAGQRLLSYVRHYRSWNGSRAGLLDDGACLDEYKEAIRGWPENALWHLRAIETLIRLGRLVDAREAVEHGYECVPVHPRRDELLRVRPAKTALHAGALLLSLELIEPVIDARADLFPEVADGRDALLGRWEQGLPFAELTFRLEGTDPEGRVVMFQPANVRVRRTAEGWVAQMPSLAMEGRAGSPSGAVEALARSLGSEARRLITTPTSDLSGKDVRQKGRLLSHVDALNSDVGLQHEQDRWIVGRVEDGRLIPTMRHLPPVEIPPALFPETTAGLYFARVPVYRDGVPMGPAEEVKPAGSSFSLAELVEQLARMCDERVVKGIMDR